MESPTLAEAARLLAAGQVSSVELTERCLAVTDLAEPSLHACVAVLAESAREQAHAADTQRARRLRHSPLLGIPLAIKDLIDVAGVPTTASSRVLHDNVATRDAEVVRRLREAGAVFTSKTNTHEFAYGTLSAPTRNPWDVSRAPGGSSGGSAVAVAVGEALGALGTDTGGSIRIPAGWCGVTGLKPTFGLVSRSGIVALSWSLDHAGPIARTVEDCAILLDALAGYDRADDDSVDVPLPSYGAALAGARSPEDALRGTRIGVPERYFFEALDGEVESAMRAALTTLERLGAMVEEVTIADPMDDLFEVYRGIQRPEAYTYHTDQGWLQARADLYSPAVLKTLNAGADYRASDYIRAQHRRRAFTRAMRQALTTCDALLTPTLAIPAPPIDGYDSHLHVGDRPIIGGALRLTLPLNLTGQPALTVPCGFSAAGLPIGMQLVATHFGEPTLLRIGHAWQRATDWHTRRPPLAEP
ncbi:MAG TPA: amidase [Ktedonobacterales bacterium]